MHGVGNYYWVDGRVYKGEWKNNRRTGHGILIYPDGRTY